MFMTIRLVYTFFISYNDHFVVVIVRTLKLCSHNNFQVFNRVLLTIVTKLYFLFQELIHLITESLYPLSNISFSQPFKLCQLPFYSLVL